MITRFGHKTIRFITELGNITLFLQRILRNFFNKSNHSERTIHQMLILGIKSLNITLITSVFVGMAFAVQVVKELLELGAAQLIGYIIGLAVWRELAPLLTAVVVAGRVGSAISAELGTMKVTEQVEALESMSQNVVDYLVVPRVIACTLMLPLLVGLADVAGFLGGFLVSIGTGQVNPYAFFDSAGSMLGVMDIAGGLIKAMFFGFVISVISCYMGLSASGGAKGVGEVTIKAVVTSLITIFILNYFLSLVIF